ncbi:unnamed protein product [Caenorhabditis sp. 36 PRJEB53466]|nr:unnamed protein product [Caenorhabditis sp. 36 PRJEB53466]
MTDDEIEQAKVLFPNVGARMGDERPCLVRFYNLCDSPIDLFWLSPQKEPTKYGTLARRKYLDISTFQLHPWVALRAFDGFKLLINKQTVFWPHAPVPNVIYRQTCFITVPMKSLRELAARAFVYQPSSVLNRLCPQLPREVQYDMSVLRSVKDEYSQVVCRSIGPVRPSSEFVVLAPPRGQ